MSRLFRILYPLAIVIGIAFQNVALSAQTSSTVIRVLDPSQVEGIAGVVLLINPGDSRQSQALITDTQGEAIAHDLSCTICAITAFDPRGSFVGRTTEFSASISFFRLVLAIQPLIDTVGDPKAMSIKLMINNSKGEPLAKHTVVIRPTVMTLENNRLSIQNTGSTGHLNVHLRAGDYTVGALDGSSVSEARFEIATAKKHCSRRAATCIVASPQSYRRLKPLSLQLSASGLSSPVPGARRD